MYRNQLNILEHFTTAKKMVKANIITEMVEHGKENGRKIDNMDLESSKIKRVFKQKVIGLMESKAKEDFQKNDNINMN